MISHSSPQPNLQGEPHAGIYSLRFWLFVVLTGVGAGLCGGLLMRLLDAAQRIAWAYSSGSYIRAIEAASPVRHVLVLLGAGALAGGGGWVLSKVAGEGSGEIEETIWSQRIRFPAIRTLAQAVLSIVIVGMGASLGREGALKQIGAVIGARLSTWACLPPSQVRLLVACGAGGGMAAAYNVPFGGALFALEVLLGSFNMRLVAPALAASASATFVSWLLLANRPTYFAVTSPIGIREIVWSILAAPIIGLFSAFYVRAISWAAARKPHQRHLIIAPLIVFPVLGGASIAFPQLLGNGKELVQAAFDDELGPLLLMALLPLKFLATGSCLGSGAPGGLFTPTLACGSLLGALLGYPCKVLAPEVSLGTFSVIGSGAMLAAATQGPVSAIVLLLELTHRIDPLMVPLLITVTGATVVAGRIEPRSIYSARIRGTRWNFAASFPHETTQS